MSEVFYFGATAKLLASNDLRSVCGLLVEINVNMLCKCVSEIAVQ